MVPSPQSVTSDQELPDTIDVAIIGGGIIGTCTALELSERGLRVALFEKGHIAGEQSGRNWGWCRQMGRDSREIPLILESMHLWQKMDQRINGETGFKTCGITYLDEDEAALQKREEWIDKFARPHQINSRIIKGEELDRLIPGASNRYKGGLFTASDGRAEPQRAAPAIAEAARQKGASVFTSCAVRGIETEAGQVSHVITERGSVKCQSVIIAAGAWSRRFLDNMGIPLPQLITQSNVQATDKLDIPYETTFSGGKYAVRKRNDGGYTIAYSDITVADIIPASFKYLKTFIPAFMSEWPKVRLRLGSRFLEETSLASRWSMDDISPFEKVRVLDPKPIDRLLQESLSELQRDYPAFKQAKIVNKWAGIIDVTPDAVPVISAIDQHPGLFLATGFSGHGFGLGPGAGKLMADLVTGSTPVVDPSPFAYARMIDGTKLKPEAGL